MLLTSSLSKCSRITKKNQFIERIVGEALKRIRGSKEFIPYSLFEASKARDTGSSRCPCFSYFTSVEEVLSLYKLAK